MSRQDVHTEHCCKVHGCKYGNDDCTVTTGARKQSFPCLQTSVCYDLDDLDEQPPKYDTRLVLLEALPILAEAVRLRSDASYVARGQRGDCEPEHEAVLAAEAVYHAALEVLGEHRHKCKHCGETFEITGAAPLDRNEVVDAAVRAAEGASGEDNAAAVAAAFVYDRRAEGSVVTEDKCPACGHEGAMVTGYLIDGQRRVLGQWVTTEPQWVTAP